MGFIIPHLDGARALVALEGAADAATLHDDKGASGAAHEERQRCFMSPSLMLAKVLASLISAYRQARLKWRWGGWDTVRRESGKQMRTHVVSASLSTGKN